MHEAHDHRRATPGDTKNFHTVGDDVEQCFQVGEVVYAHCTGCVDAHDRRSVTTLWSDSTIGGTLENRCSAVLNLLGLSTSVVEGIVATSNFAHGSLR